MWLARSIPVSFGNPGASLSESQASILTRATRKVTTGRRVCMRTVSTPTWGYPRDARLHISTNGKVHEATIRLVAILNNLHGPATELVGKVI